MANIELDHASAGPARPRALVDAYRAALYEEPVYRAPPAPVPKRPAYSRVDVGQMLRALLLVVLCVGFAKLLRAEKVQTVRGAVAAAATPRAL